MDKTDTSSMRKVLPLLTVREVREVYHCSRSTVYRWLERDRLRRVGNVPGQGDYREQTVLLVQVVDEALLERLDDWIQRKQHRGEEAVFLSEKLDLRTTADLAAEDLAQIGTAEPELLHAAAGIEDRPPAAVDPPAGTEEVTTFEPVPSEQGEQPGPEPSDSSLDPGEAANTPEASAMQPDPSPRLAADHPEEDAPSAHNDPASPAEGLGDSEAVLWGMPADPSPTALDEAIAEESSAAKEEPEPQGSADPEATLWDMPPDPVPAASQEPQPNSGDSPSATDDSSAALWGKPTEPTPAVRPRPVESSVSGQPGAAATPELVHCLSRIADAASGTRSAVEAISQHLGVGDPSSDRRAGGLFLACGCAMLALTWAAALQQRFPDGRAGLLVLLAANFVASIVILIGRRRLRRG